VSAPPPEGGAACVLDASALLAYLQTEPGHEAVEEVLDKALISSVNWSEVVQKALSRGVDVTGLRADMAALGVTVVPFDADDAEAAAGLWPETVSLGLSLGDRACLGLGMRRQAPVYTADRLWSRAALPVTVRAIR